MRIFLVSASVVSRNFRASSAGLALIASVSVAFGATAEKPPASPPNEQILRAQLFLDASAFKPGAIDGKWGEFMRKALTRYEQAQGKSAAHFGEKPPAQFDLPLDSSQPALVTYTFSPNDQKFIGAVPKTHAGQAKKDSLPYESFLELLGEKFHCRRDFLQQINPGYDWSKAKPGDSVQVPNVAAPFDVVPMMMSRKKNESRNSVSRQAGSPYLPGLSGP